MPQYRPLVFLPQGTAGVLPDDGELLIPGGIAHDGQLAFFGASPVDQPSISGDWLSAIEALVAAAVATGLVSDKRTAASPVPQDFRALGQIGGLKPGRLIVGSSRSWSALDPASITDGATGALVLDHGGGVAWGELLALGARAPLHPVHGCLWVNDKLEPAIWNSATSAWEAVGVGAGSVYTKAEADQRFAPKDVLGLALGLLFDATALPPELLPQFRLPSVIGDKQTLSWDAAAKRWDAVAAVDPANFLPLSGGTLTGPLKLAGPGNDANDPATMAQLDALQQILQEVVSKQQLWMPRSGGTFTGAVEGKTWRLLHKTDPAKGATLAYGQTAYGDRLVVDTGLAPAQALALESDVQELHDSLLASEWANDFDTCTDGRTYRLPAVSANSPPEAGPYVLEVQRESQGVQYLLQRAVRRTSGLAAGRRQTFIREMANGVWNAWREELNETADLDWRYAPGSWQGVTLVYGGASDPGGPTIGCRRNQGYVELRGRIRFGGPFTSDRGRLIVLPAGWRPTADTVMAVGGAPATVFDTSNAAWAKLGRLVARPDGDVYFYPPAGDQTWGEVHFGSVRFYVG